MVINKKIKRTMLENRAQYFGSLVLIIISCMLYTMFNQLTSSMNNISTSFEKNYVQEDANFITDKRLQDMASIEKKFNMLIEESGSLDYKVSEGKTLRIFSENNKVDIPAVVKGTNLSGKDILLDPAYAAANKIEIGSSINIYGKSFKVAGFMSLPNYIYPLKQESDLLNDPKGFGIAVITKEDFQGLGRGNLSYSIKFKGDKSNVDGKISEFKEYLKNQGVVVLGFSSISENPRVTYVTAKIQGINQMSAALPIFILLLTCILTGIVIWRMLQREFVYVGTLYSLGYRKQEIMRHYLAYPLIVSLLGGIIGTALGALTLRPMIDVMISYFNMPVGNLVFDAKYVIISLLLPIVFLMVCSFFVINRALKYSPLDLIKGGKEKTKVGFIEKRLKLDRFKFSTKFKLREQLRSVPRSIFLLLGVATATMLLLMGFAMKSSIDFMLKDDYYNTFKYKYQYMLNSLEKGAPANSEGFSVTAFSLKTDSKTSFGVYGINPDSKYISLKNGDEAIDLHKIVITRPLADKLNVKAGDTIAAVNKLDSKEYKLTIDSIANTYVGEYIYMPIDKFNTMLNYPAGSYMGLWSSSSMDIAENKLLSSMTIDDVKAAFDSLTKPMQEYVGAISVMSFLIGLIVIYVVTSLIIEENKGNISLMKVLGYKKKEVYSLILNSSSIIVVLGYIIGVPMLTASLGQLIKSATKGMNVSFPITINYLYVIIGFVIIYASYELSKAVSRRKVNRISMTEALKSGRE